MAFLHHSTPPYGDVINMIKSLGHDMVVLSCCSVETYPAYHAYVVHGCSPTQKH